MRGFVLIFAPKGVPQDSTTTRIAEVGRFRTTTTSRWHDAAQHSTLDRLDRLDIVGAVDVPSGYLT